MIQTIFLYMIGHHNATAIYLLNAQYVASLLVGYWKYRWEPTWTEEKHINWKNRQIDILDAEIFMAENPIYEECYGRLIFKVDISKT